MHDKQWRQQVFLARRRQPYGGCVVHVPHAVRCDQCVHMVPARHTSQLKTRVIQNKQERPSHKETRGKQDHPKVEEEGSTTERRSRPRSITLKERGGAGTTAQEEEGGPPLHFISLSPSRVVLLFLFLGVVPVARLGWCCTPPSFCVVLVVPLAWRCLLFPPFRWY